MTLLWITMQPTLGRKHIYDSDSNHGTPLGRTLVCYFYNFIALLLLQCVFLNLVWFKS